MVTFVFVSVYMYTYMPILITIGNSYPSNIKCYLTVIINC